MTVENQFELIKRIIFQQILLMRNDDENQRIIIIPRINNILNQTEIEIRTIQSSFNPEIFSAVIRIKNFLLMEQNESAQVQLMILLNEVSENMQISENLVRFIRLNFYNGNNIEGFIARIPQIVVRDWNNS